MFAFFDYFREMTHLSVFMRLGLAVICGGLIGIEREMKHRAAGFRTHILICMGAAITTLTSQYIYLVLGMFTDLARLGAQVISGIGFIGAGAIMVTQQTRIKGLTTAAGLWVSALIGLACGAGFIECTILATITVLVAEILLIKLEYIIADNIRDRLYYIEYEDAMDMENILDDLARGKILLLDIEISRSLDRGGYTAMLSVRPQNKRAGKKLFEIISKHEKVLAVEQL